MAIGLSNISNTYLQNSSWRQNKVPSQNNAASFSRVLASQDVSASRVDEYKKHLESKYGRVMIQSVGKDQASLDRIGAGMTGRDVVIAQNILEAMAADSQKASHYEGKIDYFFSKIPEYTASFAARGLVFEPGGVVIHEDGTVTYISGCSDSPERVAEVEAINKARQEKKAEQRRKLLERSQEESMKQRQLLELYMQKCINNK